MDGRENSIRKQFLLWLAENERRQPKHNEFLIAAAGVVDGVQATEDEVIRVLRNLDNHRLVTGVRVNELDYPLRLSLRPEGRIVVDDYDADVDTWLRRGIMIDQSVRVGSAVNLAAHSSEVVQLAIDNRAVVQAAEAVAQAIPALGLDGQSSSELQVAAAEVVEAGKEGGHRLQAAGKKLLGLLESVAIAAGSTALTNVLIAQLHAAGVT